MYAMAVARSALHKSWVTLKLGASIRVSHIGGRSLTDRSPTSASTLLGNWNLEPEPEIKPGTQMWDAGT